MNIDAIKDKLARARSDYKDALERLKIVREAQAVTGSAYASALDRQNTLNAKIAAAETDLDNANKLIRSQLEKNHFVKTEAVRSAMNEKAEAEAIKAELLRVLKAGELQTLKRKLAASQDTKELQAVFLSAHDAYARVQIYEALVSHGPALSSAMAQMLHVVSSPIENILIDPEQVKESRIAFVWKALKAMADECPESVQRPHVVAIGMLEMGPFSDGNFIAPMEALKLRKLIEEGESID